MNAIEYPSWCADCWVATQVFRKLGFSADDIFFGHVDVEQVGRCAVVALCIGEKQFTWVVDRLEGDTAEIEVTWKEFLAALNAASDAERKAVWNVSTVLPRTGFSYIELWKGLRAKGIACPAFAEADEKLDAILGGN